MVASPVLRAVVGAAEERLDASSVRIDVGRGVNVEIVDAEGRAELMEADDGRDEEACGLGVCTGVGTLVTLTALVTLATLVALSSAVLVAVAVGVAEDKGP